MSKVFFFGTGGEFCQAVSQPRYFIIYMMKKNENFISTGGGKECIPMLKLFSQPPT